MKLREELDNRSVEKKGIVAPVDYFTNQEKEELFHILRKEADKGLTSCVITDYILSFPFLVNNVSGVPNPGSNLAFFPNFFIASL